VSTAKAPRSEPRITQATAHPLLEPVPGVGVSLHDLRFLAVAVTRAFGMNGSGAAATETEIIGAAINQATFDLDAIATALGEQHAPPAASSTTPCST